MNLSLLEYGNIRITPNNRLSVFDTIQIIGGKVNPRRTWKEIAEVYPEVVRKTYNYQFPGKGQRPTPVSEIEGIFIIIGLLPGAVGKAYREDAAREMCKKYGVSYESIVNEEVAITAEHKDINLATLEVAGRIADGILQAHKATIAKLDNIQNLVQGTAVDVKGEIREGNHALSEEVKTVQQELFDLKAALNTVQQSITEIRKPRDRKDLSITFHCSTIEQYEQLLTIVESSGMSRSKFFLDLVLQSLGMEIL